MANPALNLGDEPVLARLAALGRRRRYRQGSYIVLQGDVADSLFLILAGSVAVRVREENGDETVMVHLFAGEIFGEVCLSPGTMVRSADVLAREDVEAVEVPFTRFVNAARDDPDLWVRIVSQLSDRLRDVTDRVRILARRNATQRIAHLLQELGASPDAQSTPRGRVISISREELGSMAGCTREMVSRGLRELARSGFVELDRRRIVVTGLLAG